MPRLRLFPFPGLNKPLTVILYLLLVVKGIMLICWYKGIKPPPGDHVLTVLLGAFLLFPLTKGLILTLVLHGWIKRRREKITVESAEI